MKDVEAHVCAPRSRWSRDIESQAPVSSIGADRVPGRSHLAPDTRDSPRVRANVRRHRSSRAPDGRAGPGGDRRRHPLASGRPGRWQPGQGKTAARSAPGRGRPDAWRSRGPSPRADARRRLEFPAQWDRLLAAVPVRYRQRDVVDSYAAWLSDPEPEERGRAALEWCTWESATPGWPPHEGLESRFHDADYALAFARIVTHFVRHNAWLEDGVLIRDARLISHLPAFLVTGRFDFQAPISNAWELKRVWPAAQLVIVDEAGHGNAEVGLAVVRATDQLAQTQL